MPSPSSTSPWGPAEGRCGWGGPRSGSTPPPPPGDPPNHPTFVGQAKETVPRVAVAELPGGRVLGPHRAVIDGRGTLIDEFSPYFGISRWREHPIFWHPFPGEPL